MCDFCILSDAMIDEADLSLITPLGTLSALYIHLAMFRSLLPDDPQTHGEPFHILVSVLLSLVTLTHYQESRNELLKLPLNPDCRLTQLIDLMYEPPEAENDGGRVFSKETLVVTQLKRVSIKDIVDNADDYPMNLPEMFKMFFGWMGVTGHHDSLIEALSTGNMETLNNNIGLPVVCNRNNVQQKMPLKTTTSEVQVKNTELDVGPAEKISLDVSSDKLKDIYHLRGQKYAARKTSTVAMDELKTAERSKNREKNAGTSDSVGPEEALEEDILGDYVLSTCNTSPPLTSNPIVIEPLQDQPTENSNTLPSSSAQSTRGDSTLQSPPANTEENKTADSDPEREQRLCEQRARLQEENRVMGTHLNMDLPQHKAPMVAASRRKTLTKSNMPVATPTLKTKTKKRPLSAKTNGPLLKTMLSAQRYVWQSTRPHVNDQYRISAPPPQAPQPLSIAQVQPVYTGLNYHNPQPTWQPVPVPIQQPMWALPHTQNYVTPIHSQPSPPSYQHDIMMSVPSPINTDFQFGAPSAIPLYQMNNGSVGSVLEQPVANQPKPSHQAPVFGMEQAVMTVNEIPSPQLGMSQQQYTPMMTVQTEVRQKMSQIVPGESFTDYGMYSLYTYSTLTYRPILAYIIHYRSFSVYPV